VFTRWKRDTNANADAGARPSRDRRRAARRAAAWDSRYLVADPDREQIYISDSDYSECVLRNLSTEGVGFECSGRELEVGDRVVVDLRLGARHRASIRVTGEVRHTVSDEDGVVRAGVEFVEVGDLERALLLRLVRDLDTTDA
jgi:hypothetical protein